MPLDLHGTRALLLSSSYPRAVLSQRWEQGPLLSFEICSLQRLGGSLGVTLKCRQRADHRHAGASAGDAPSQLIDATAAPASTTDKGPAQAIAPRRRRRDLAPITDPISVLVKLILIEHRWAVVAQITDPVIILIFLSWISLVGAEVAAITDPISVSIWLLSRGEARADIARVAEPILIEICLLWVRDHWAVVSAAADPIEVWIFKAGTLLIEGDTLVEPRFTARPEGAAPIGGAGLGAEGLSTLIQEGEAEVFISPTLPALCARRAGGERFSGHTDIGERGDELASPPLLRADPHELITGDGAAAHGLNIRREAELALTVLGAPTGVTELTKLYRLIHIGDRRSAPCSPTRSTSSGCSTSAGLRGAIWRGDGARVNTPRDEEHARKESPLRAL